MIRYAALLFALVIGGLGLLGLTVPETFRSTVEFFQAGHRIYIAGAIRVIIGLVFFAEADGSRWPTAMRVAGGGVVLLGLLTPVSTHPIPSVTRGWWSSDFTRPWAFSAMAIALFVIAAVVPPRDLQD